MRNPTARPGAMGARQDVTDRGTAPVYFKDANFDETVKEYKVTKMMFGALGIIAVMFALTFLMNLSLNFLVLDIILLAFWLVYFITGLAMKNKLDDMPLKDRSPYWTFEHTDDYAQMNVKINDFKRLLASSPLVDRTTLLTDVRVNIMNLDPLVFNFSLRSSRANERDVIRQVSGWAGKFDAFEGIVERTGNNTYKATYPMKGQWEVLAGVTVSPRDALSTRTQEPSIDWNPFGLRTTDKTEVAVVNTDQHIMLCGASGYGKSACLNSILQVIMQDDTDPLVIFFDGKRVESAAVKDRCWQVYDGDQALAWCDAVEEEMKRRMSYQEDNGKKKFATPEKANGDPDAIAFSDEFPPITCVVDECAIWLTADAMPSMMSGMKFVSRFTTFLNNVTRIGRSCGVTLIVAAQEAKAGSIPQGTRNNIDQRIAFKQMTSANDEFAIGEFRPGEPKPSEIPAKAPHAGGGIGQCCARTATTNGEVWPVKAYYVSSDDCKKTAKKNAFRKKQYDVVQRAYAIYNSRRKQVEAKKEFVPFQ